MPGAQRRKLHQTMQFKAMPRTYKPYRAHIRALMRLSEEKGLRETGQARTMGGHSTQNQTADFIRHKKPKKTGATR